MTINKRKVQSIKEKNDKLEFIKILNIYSEKEKISHRLEKIFSIYFFKLPKYTVKTSTYQKET